MPRWRIPTKDDPFLHANAGRMFELLKAVDEYPQGHTTISEELRLQIQQFFGEALADGIDIIAVSESGLAQGT